MFRSFNLRILLCIGLSVAAIAGSFLVVPGIRHRHDGGEAAHSHSAHGHSHSHGHGHSHGHSHSHANHTHQNAAVEEEPSSHIHFSLFGLELTLPDFLGGEPAPLVDNAPKSQKEVAVQGEMIRLPSPFSLAQLIDVTLRWTAIGCSFVQIEGNETSFCRTAIPSDFKRGIDPSAPLLPPPEAP